MNQIIAILCASFFSVTAFAQAAEKNANADVKGGLDKKVIDEMIKKNISQVGES